MFETPETCAKTDSCSAPLQRATATTEHAYTNVSVDIRNNRAIKQAEGTSGEVGRSHSKPGKIVIEGKKTATKLHQSCNKDYET
jgi:hypothetical protein